MNFATDEDPLEYLTQMNNDELTELAKKSPWHKATSRDVDYVEKVRMQGAVQKWVDHSISVTINMPEDVTEEIIDQCYQTAHEVGCKGMTVYRDNSRGNVLSVDSVKGERTFEYIAAHKRPEWLFCDIYFKSARKEAFIILVGKVEKKPYEVFAIPNNGDTYFSKGIKAGKIVKKARGRYELQSLDGSMLIESITSHMIENEQNETRSISALLRHRVDPQWIVNSILEKYATINSFHKVIGKVLSSYVEDEVNGVECPQSDCDGKMVMTEGCMKCESCGYAHCG
jgi:ribonucleoside-diphosphate reductase alpha chain